jgi:hypothetical protein
MVRRFTPSPIRVLDKSRTATGVFPRTVKVSHRAVNLPK